MNEAFKVVDLRIHRITSMKGEALFRVNPNAMSTHFQLFACSSWQPSSASLQPLSPQHGDC